MLLNLVALNAYLSKSIAWRMKPRSISTVSSEAHGYFRARAILEKISLNIDFSGKLYAL